MAIKLAETSRETPARREMLSEMPGEMLAETPLRSITVATLVPMFFRVEVRDGDTDAAVKFALDAVKAGDIAGRYNWDSKSDPAAVLCVRRDLGGKSEAIPERFSPAELWGAVPPPARSISQR